jgi:hypothetical protein
MAVLRRQSGLVAAALVVAGVGLVMLNAAAYLALSQSMSPASAALVVALCNMALAAILLVSANKATVGEEVDAMAEVRDLAIEDLEAEVRTAAQEAKAAAESVKALAKNPLGSITPTLAAGLAKAIVKTSKK